MIPTDFYGRNLSIFDLAILLLAYGFILFTVVCTKCYEFYFSRTLLEKSLKTFKGYPSMQAFTISHIVIIVCNRKLNSFIHSLYLYERDIFSVCVMGGSGFEE